MAETTDLLRIPALTKIADEALVALFETANLFPERRPDRWSAPEARSRALALALNPTSVFLGRRVAAAFGVGGSPYFAWERLGGWSVGGDLVRYVVLPHPSGLNRLYNDEAVRREVGSVLLQTIRSAMEGQ